MKSRLLYAVLILTMILLQGCTLSKKLSAPSANVIKSTGELPRQTPISSEQLATWPYKDVLDDSIPGISLRKARTLLGKRKGSPVLVSVIDSAIDIDHPHLTKSIWTNTTEIPDNGMDDDHNGYIDDVSGWNFLGSMYNAQLEITRIVQKYAAQFEDDSSTMARERDPAGFELYTNARHRYDSVYDRVSTYYHDLLKMYDENSQNAEMEKHITHMADVNRYHYNVDFEPRTEDDPDDITDVRYGNPVITPVDSNESHGTHVAGVIRTVCAELVTPVQILPVRAIPNGDEYDKDVALAIRYAVDNGARVINMSFGKNFSPHKEWVWDAIQYAEGKDVLLVLAAGNESTNIDRTPLYPSDIKDGQNEFAHNMITVGSITPSLDERLVSPFSNFGKTNVDVFAPGSEISSTLPNGKYGYKSGTSMAASLVTGVAAVIRSYYPELTARQVKDLVMTSGARYEGLVLVPGGMYKAKRFSELSASGCIVNAYNAILLADKISKQ